MDWKSIPIQLKRNRMQIGEEGIENMFMHMVLEKYINK
jgi:hypothetical protein